MTLDHSILLLDALFSSEALWQIGWKICRRARLRIAKSSISKRSFSFQKPIDLRGESAIFRGHHRFHDRRVKRHHSSTISSTRTDLSFRSFTELATNLIGPDLRCHVLYK
jgi:hypothetical protein